MRFTFSSPERGTLLQLELTLVERADVRGEFYRSVIHIMGRLAGLSHVTDTEEWFSHDLGEPFKRLPMQDFHELDSSYFAPFKSLKVIGPDRTINLEML